MAETKPRFKTHDEAMSLIGRASSVTTLSEIRQIGMRREITMEDDCALKGTGPAATLSESERVPTASDDLVKELAASIAGAYFDNDDDEAISPDIGRDEYIRRTTENWKPVAQDVLSSPPVREIVKALDNINMQAVPGPTEGWLMIPKTEWDAIDIGSILSRFQSVGGDDVDASSPMGSQAIASSDEGGV